MYISQKNAGLAYDVGCGMYDVGCTMWDVRCGMWDVRCGMYDVGCGIYYLTRRIKCHSQFVHFGRYQV